MMILCFLSDVKGSGELSDEGFSKMQSVLVNRFGSGYFCRDLLGNIFRLQAGQSWRPIV